MWKVKGSIFFFSLSKKVAPFDEICLLPIGLNLFLIVYAWAKGPFVLHIDQKKVR